jgi:hypothetical protein
MLGKEDVMGNLGRKWWRHEKRLLCITFREWDRETGYLLRKTSHKLPPWNTNEVLGWIGSPYALLSRLLARQKRRWWCKGCLCTYFIAYNVDLFMMMMQEMKEISHGKLTVMQTQHLSCSSMTSKWGIDAWISMRTDKGSYNRNLSCLSSFVQNSVL